jgi:GTPase SAR1 family protein
MEGSTPCYRIKLLVVGQENVGKTSILRRLKTFSAQGSKGFGLKRNRAPTSINAPPISTDGIDIEDLTLCAVEKDGQRKALQFSTWDFAGQGS